MGFPEIPDLDKTATPGPIILFGSGETSPSGQKIFDTVLRRMRNSPSIALLETPAGFELNSARVIGRVGEFIQHHLQNYQPQVVTVPARNRLSAYSPDDPQVIEPLYHADLVFMGPGSPSYAVRQLQGSQAWYAMLARHRLGGAIALASAAVVAISAYALPVYEIYKVGEELHWKPGLDFFGMYGLPLVFIPHWNNSEGGEELDTSRCFMGQMRFARLVEMLPPGLTLVGIDEKTGLIIHPQDGECQVIGSGGVTLIHTGESHQGAAPELELQGTGLAEVAEKRQGHVHEVPKYGNFFPCPDRRLQPAGCRSGAPRCGLGESAAGVAGARENTPSRPARCLPCWSSARQPACARTGPPPIACASASRSSAGR